MKHLMLITIFTPFFITGIFAQNEGITIGNSNETTNGTIRYKSATGFEGLHLGNWLPLSGTNTATSSWLTNGSAVYYNAGDVGIGITTPESKLQVWGGVDLDLTNGGYMMVGVSAWINTVFDRNSIQARANGAAHRLDLQTEGGDLGLVIGGGNVGVGTTNPIEKFHVNGDVATGAIFTSNGQIGLGRDGTGNRNSFVDFYTNDVTNTFGSRIVRWSGQNGGLDITQNGTGAIALNHTAAGDIKFLTNSLDRMRIKADGKIMIGSPTTPGNYKLYVQTGILTERVKIATVGSAQWADYVFEEDYKLKPLDEVEQFVQENKHLPNIPSAKEVEQKGYELQKMDALLLEKIEELYLHSIELKKENTKLENTVEKLLKRIEQLEGQ